MNKVILNSDQKTVRVTELLIEDPRAHKILSRENPDSVDQKVRDALTIGFLAIDRTAAMAEADWVSQRLEHQILAVNYSLERRSNEVMEAIQSQLDPAKAGSLLAPVAELVKRTQGEISGRLSETLAALQTSQSQLGHALDPSRDGAVLKVFLDRFETIAKEFSTSPHLQTKLDGLRDEVKAMAVSFKVGVDAERALIEANESAINSSPAKGLVFEDQVLSELRKIAEIRNDLVEVVGTQTGKGTSKKGDLVYYVSSLRARIVMELKDYGSSRFTFAKIKDLIEQSKGNRDAQYGIFLVKDEGCLPDGVGRFYLADDFCIATQDFLEVAVKIAIAMSHHRVARLTAGSGPDWVSIEANIEEIRSTIGDLSDLEGSCATALRAMSKTGDGIKRISKTLAEKVECLLSEVSKKEAV